MGTDIKDKENLKKRSMEASCRGWNPRTVVKRAGKQTIRRRKKVTRGGVAMGGREGYIGKTGLNQDRKKSKRLDVPMWKTKAGTLLEKNILGGGGKQRKFSQGRVKRAKFIPCMKSS